jgi:hypothetical protein
LSFDLAVANGAVALGMGSQALMKRAEQRGYFVAAAIAGIKAAG